MSGSNIHPRPLAPDKSWRAWGDLSPTADWGERTVGHRRPLVEKWFGEWALTHGWTAVNDYRR